jgi:hypothetical protein
MRGAKGNPSIPQIFKQIYNKKTGLLYYLIMFWIARNSIFLRQRQEENYAAVDAFAMLQIAIIGAIALIILTFSLKSFLHQIKTSSLKWYFLYYILAMISSFFLSSNPTFSLYRAIEVIVMSLAVLFFCMHTFTVHESIQRTRIIIWSTLIITVVGMAIQGGGGLFWHSNGLGATAAMAACFFSTWTMAAGFKRNRTLIFQGTIGTYFMFASLSLASWWSYWLGICCCGLVQKNKILVFILFIVGLSLFSLIDTDTRDELLVRGRDEQSLTQMTGRKLIWDDYIVASGKKPVLGYGFAIGAREVGSIYTTDTHNSFFAALMGMGWIGVFIWVVFFFKLGFELFQFRHSFHPAWLATASALAAGLLNSMSLSILAEQWIISTTVFVAFLGLHASFLRQAKLNKRLRYAV